MSDVRKRVYVIEALTKKSFEETLEDFLNDSDYNILDIKYHVREHSGIYSALVIFTRPNLKENKND